MYTMNPYETKPATNSKYRLQLKRLMKNTIETELTDQQRKIFIMHYIQDKKVTAIARELGISKQAVSITLDRAKKKLEKCKKTFEGVLV